MGMEYRYTLRAGEFLVGEQFVFNLSPADIHSIYATPFSINASVNDFVTAKAIEHYRLMMPGSRVCALTIVVLRPMTRLRAEQLNNTRITMANSIAAATGALSAPAIGPASVGVAAGVRMLVFSEMAQMHDGDIVVQIEGVVSGGIGPQRSIKHYILPRREYDFDYGV